MNWIKIDEATELSRLNKYLLYDEGDRDYVAVRWSEHYLSPVCLNTGALLNILAYTHYAIITDPND